MCSPAVKRFPARIAGCCRAGLTYLDDHEADEGAQHNLQLVAAGVALLQAAAAEDKRLAMFVQQRAVRQGVQCGRGCDAITLE